jgi:hypothetical protein
MPAFQQTTNALLYHMRLRTASMPHVRVSQSSE